MVRCGSSRAVLGAVSDIDLIVARDPHRDAPTMLHLHGGGYEVSTQFTSMLTRCTSVARFTAWFYRRHTALCFIVCAGKYSLAVTARTGHTYHIYLRLSVCIQYTVH